MSSPLLHFIHFVMAAQSSFPPCFVKFAASNVLHFLHFHSFCTRGTSPMCALFGNTAICWSPLQDVHIHSCLLQFFEAFRQGSINIDTAASLLGLRWEGIRSVFSLCSFGFEGCLIWVTFNCCHTKQMNHEGKEGCFSKRSGVQGKVSLWFLLWNEMKKKWTGWKVKLFELGLGQTVTQRLLSWTFYLWLSTNRYWSHTCLPWKGHQTEVLLFHWRSWLMDYSQGFDGSCSCFRKFILGSHAALCRLSRGKILISLSKNSAFRKILYGKSARC